MRKFLINTAIYSGIIIIFLGIGEIIARHIPSSYKVKADRMDNKASGISTLILGTSHTYYGINSALLGDSVFNLANVSQYPYIDFMLLEKYSDSLTNLKKIIIPVGYSTFVDEPLEDSDEWFRIIDYKIQMNLTDHSDISKYNFEISDFERYSEKLKNLILKSPNNMCDSLGFGLGYNLDRRSPDWNSKDNLNYLIKTSTKPIRKDIASNTEKSLRQIIQWCKHRDIMCFIVSTPVFPIYYSEMNPTQLDDMYRRIKNICQDYDVVYLDHINDTGFAEEDFFDFNHLSDKGATKFTRLIKEEIL